MLGVRVYIIFCWFFECVFLCCFLDRTCPIFVDLGLHKGPCWDRFSQFLQISHGKKRAEIEARKLMVFESLLGGAGGTGEGLPESSDSAEHGEWVQSRPAPPAGVRRIFRATPSAAGPF